MKNKLLVSDHSLDQVWIKLKDTSLKSSVRMQRIIELSLGSDLEQIFSCIIASQNAVLLTMAFLNILTMQSIESASAN